MIVDRKETYSLTEEEVSQAVELWLRTAKTKHKPQGCVATHEMAQPGPRKSDPDEFRWQCTYEWQEAESTEIPA